MSWELPSPFDAAHRAALEHAKPLVYVAPPAGWTLPPLFASGHPGAGPDRRVVLLVPDRSLAERAGDALAPIESLQPIHVLAGRSRAARLLRAGAVHTLVATPGDALALVRDTVLKLAGTQTLVLGWPELLEDEGTAALDTVLAEARDAQRLLVTSDATRVRNLMERHAHRAPVAAVDRLPAERTVETVRYAVVGWTRRQAAVRTALDQLEPATACLWDPYPDAERRWGDLLRDPALRLGADGASVTLAVAVDLPGDDVLRTLAAAADEVLVLCGAGQVPYLARLAGRLRHVRLVTEADRARDRGADLRRRVRARLDAGELDGELLALAPLFEEYDPALVAAAAAAAAATGGAGPEATPAGPATAPAWVRLRVNVGRLDRLRPGDLVGALLNAVGLRKDHIGRIEIRDKFTLVEVHATDAEAAVRGLTGTSLRGRRATVRVEGR